jgi:two-component system, chemotaxis family, sensor kinase CheA
MTAMSSAQLRSLFAQEAEGRLAQLGQLLLQLEQAGEDEALVRSIFREIHTIKGSSAVAGLDDVSRIAHDLEELVDNLRAGERPVTAEMIDTLLRGADQLTAAINAPPNGGPVSDAPEAAPEAPRPLRPDPAVGSDSSARHPVAASEVPAASNAGAPSNGVAASNGAPRPASPPKHVERNEDGRAAAVIGVPVERLDELTRLVGETASAHLRIGRMLKDRFKIDPATATEFNEMSRLLNDLQDRAMRTQMVPISTITDQLHRAVRDLARSQGKNVRWEARGTDTELDRGVLHKLSDSLVHLVRNAVDHGIELPEERQRAGKDPQATVRLHAMQLGSEVIIAVTDDGHGIDAASVAQQANRRGIDTNGMTEEEILGLTFHAGLSTTQFVTDVSGRGVGLDVVRTKVESTHGRVEVRSEWGVGTEFRIIVPITTAVLRCLLVEAGGQSFALPFHRVLVSKSNQAATVTHAEGRPVVRVEGQAVPVQALAETIGLAAGGTRGPLVVLSDTARRHAFQVDRLIGQRDVVIKALSPLLPHLPAVAGASVEPDGSILVVLDPPGLIQRAKQAIRTTGPKVQDERVPVRRRSVLVVDDALTVRELQRTILERAGFQVRVATDGKQALSALAEAPSDLVLTDIEMPNMDGFELTRAIRSHPTLTNIPVLILSSRTSADDRQRGLDAGADGYIQKSRFDEASLLTAVNRLLGAST